MKNLLNIEKIKEVLENKAYNIYIIEWIKTRKKAELVKALETGVLNKISSISPILTAIEEKVNKMNNINEIVKLYTTFLYVLKGGFKDDDKFKLLDIYALTKLYKSKYINSSYMKEIEKLIYENIKYKDDFLDFRERVINMVALYRRYYLIKLINKKINKK